VRRCGRADKRKKKEEGRNFYLVPSCSHHNGEDDEDTIGTGNGHNCRGAVAHGNRTPVRIQQINIYTRRKGLAHLPLLHRRDVGREEEGA